MVIEHRFAILGSVKKPVSGTGDQSPMCSYIFQSFTINPHIFLMIRLLFVLNIDLGTNSSLSVLLFFLSELSIGVCVCVCVSHSAVSDSLCLHGL